MGLQTSLVDQELSFENSEFIFEVTPFYFLRHGETDETEQGILLGQTDADLNARGRRTVQNMARRVAGLELGSIYVSPLRRAQSSAAIFSELVGTDAPVRVLPGLEERYWGVYQGRPRAERPTTRNPETAETFEDFSGRVLAAMRSITGPSPVLVVAHSGVFRALAAFAGQPNTDPTPIRVATLLLFEPPTGEQTQWRITEVTG